MTTQAILQTIAAIAVTALLIWTFYRLDKGRGTQRGDGAAAAPEGTQSDDATERGGDGGARD